MLVDRHTRRLDVPGEPGEWFDLRRLTFGELHELRQLSGERFLEELSGLPADVLDAQLRIQEELRQARNAAAAEAEEAGEDAEEEVDPLAGMDTLTILRHGVVAWSYREQSGDPVPVESASVAMLDEKTARWAAREIMLLGEGEGEARLKGSSPLTASSTE